MQACTPAIPRQTRWNVIFSATPYGVKAYKWALIRTVIKIWSQTSVLLEGTGEELDCELPDRLRDLRRVKGRDLDVDRERRRVSDVRAVPRYGAGEYRFFCASLSECCRRSTLQKCRRIFLQPVYRPCLTQYSKGNQKPQTKHLGITTVDHFLRYIFSINALSKVHYSKYMLLLFK